MDRRVRISMRILQKFIDILIYRGGDSGCGNGCPSGEVCLGGQCVSCSWSLDSSCYNLVPADNKMLVDEGEEYCSSHFKGNLVSTLLIMVRKDTIE